MTARLTILGGSDWSDGAVLFAADQNDTIKAIDGVLGEVKMFALSMTGATTKAALQTRGWAICDGTTPATQGISSPTIETTPDLQDKFISMSNDETSGTTGGASSVVHNHKWLNDDGSGTGKFDMTAGSGRTYNTSGANLDLTSATWEADSWTDNDTTATLPPFYELVYFMKVKI